MDKLFMKVVRKRNVGRAICIHHTGLFEVPFKFGFVKQFLIYCIGS